jgi:hypothetical protein
MAINGVYLPGWEYNRLLASNPLTPRNSALPGAAFWNGGGLFWLFEHVYCTSDSLANEAYAADKLGWATSKAFVGMSESMGYHGPILKTIDWTTDLPQDVGTRLEAKYAKIRNDLKAEGGVRTLIDRNQDGRLELLNYDLLEDVAFAKNAIVAGTLNGLSQWAVPETGSSAKPPPRPVDRLLKAIAHPTTANRNGLKLMTPPSGWSPHVRAAQKRARAISEAPYVHDLFAGEKDFAGPRGYEAYIDRAAVSKPDYELADNRLSAEWEESQKRLLRLRDVASKHLWPKLHNEWIPGLVEGNPEALQEVPVRFAQVLASTHFADLLTERTALLLLAFGQVSQEASDYSEPSTRLHFLGHATNQVSAALAALIMSARSFAPNVVPLTVFYQDARRTLIRTKPTS